MGEINWFVTILIGAMLSIPFSVIANLLTPKIQIWWERRSLSTQGKTLARLKSDYERIKQLHDNSTILQLTVFSWIIKGFIALFLVILIVIIVPLITSTNNLISVVLSVILVLMIPVLATVILWRLMALDTDLTRLRHFEKYTADALAQIDSLEKKLAGKPT